MADSNTPTAAATPAQTAKSRQLIAVKDLKALQIVEEVLAASQVAGRPARFINERALTAAFFTDMGNRATLARQKATAMTNRMVVQKTATADEATFKKRSPKRWAPSRAGPRKNWNAPRRGVYRCMASAKTCSA